MTITAPLADIDFHDESPASSATTNPAVSAPAASASRPEPLVSVVVAFRGNPDQLPGLLQAIAGQRGVPGRLEVVVVDNNGRRPTMHPGSRHPLSATSPHSVAPVVQVAPEVRVVHEPRAGLSRARNLGIAAARGRFVLITDPDSRPAPTWAAQLVTALRATDAYCVGGRVVPRYTGPPPDLGPELAALFIPPSWPHQIAPLTGDYWLVGCNLGIRRAPQPTFDHRFGAQQRGRWTCEDLEFVARCQRSGHPVVIAPHAVVERAIHPSDVTTWALLRRGFGHGRSMARLQAKHTTVEILDRYDLAHILMLRRTNTRTAAVSAARIAGYTLERALCGPRGWRRRAVAQNHTTTDAEVRS